MKKNLIEHLNLCHILKQHKISNDKDKNKNTTQYNY
jgi:hypothetical protein